MLMGREWTGFEAAVLQRVTRQSVREFAQGLGIDPKTVSTWRSRGESITPQPLTARLLDITLDRASNDERAEFYRIIADPTARTLGAGASSTTRPFPDVGSRNEFICVPMRSGDDDHVVRTPPGRYFAGTATPAIVIRATMEADRVVAPASDATVPHPFLTRSHRGLVVATTETSDGPQYFGLDRRRARSRVALSNLSAPLLIPPAYKLDEFTLALLWAVANLEDALLEDDAELALAAQQLVGVEATARQLGDTEPGSDLSAVSRMWLGSDYCARHILRHVDQLSATPQIWTREQRGEEAATWLLFAHKYDYLVRTAATFTDTPTRAFCIPRASVDASPRPERILMLLTAALIESVGITVTVCTEPEFTTTQGFVLDPGRRAIVATWANADHIRVDVTDHRPALREYGDAAGWAHSHSILDTPNPHRRLRALADYLDLDWAWVTTRAAEIGDYGTAGFSTPRSRLLSLAGLDRACRFLGDRRRQDR